MFQVRTPVERPLSRLSRIGRFILTKLSYRLERRRFQVVAQTQALFVFKIADNKKKSRYGENHGTEKKKATVDYLAGTVDGPFLVQTSGYVS
jgi:hypothetical protein